MIHCCLYFILENTFWGFNVHIITFAHSYAIKV